MTNSIKQIMMAFAVGCGAVSVLTACSDKWDDHYDGTASGANMNSGSLWQALEDNIELSNFAKVVQATGFDRSLKGSQVFTVFAPTNASFSESDAEAMIDLYNQEKAASKRDEDNKAIKEFVKNHLSLYNYSVAEGRIDTITTMNGKRHALTSSQFSNINLGTKNALYSNGVLFTLDKVVPYYANVFEYLEKDADLSKASEFFYNKRHYRLKFDAERSVPDSIRDGETVYSDSVMIQENTLFDYDALDAKLNSEDSTYWMVVPTNDVWDALVAKYEPYFNYDKAIEKDLKGIGDADSLAYTNTRLAIMGGTIFSRTLNTDKMLADSAMSTNAYEYELREYKWGADTLAYYQYQKPMQTIMANTTNVLCSNGQVMKSNNWKFEPKQTFMRDIIVEAEDARAIKELVKKKVNKDTIETVIANPVFVQPDNPYYGKISGHSYVEFTQLVTGGNTQHEVIFWIPEVLSNVPYDIYVRTAPGLAGDTAAVDLDRAPIRLMFEIGYRGLDGKAKKETIYTPAESQKDSVDMLLVKEGYKFPVCSYGVEESDPQITLKVSTYVTDAEVSAMDYQRTMRIDCIILKPREE